MVRHLLATLVTVSWFAVGVPPAQAAPLFAEVSKDFGSVPRGTLLTHHFKLTNPTTAPLRVAGLRTSCQCVTVAVERPELPPGESTAVLVTIDTRKFSGAKSFTVYVLFDRPFVEEAQLLVHAHSRDDVTLTPGQLAFGRVRKGTGPAASVTIEYRGPAGWEIQGVENDNAYLLPQLQEIGRGPGVLTYQLTVKLRPDIPVGAWHADVWLKTNDPHTPRIRVPLTVEIEGAITPTPSELVFGRVPAGGRMERRVVLRSMAPFKITQIDGADALFQVEGKSDEAKTVHVLTVTFTAGSSPGEVTRRFRVHTDLPDEGPVEFSAQAQVVP
jgi:hypothetical protein